MPKRGEYFIVIFDKEVRDVQNINPKNDVMG